MRALDDAALTALLREDAPFGDLTTQALRLTRRPGVLVATARGAQVAAATEEAARLIELAGGTVEAVTPSGTRLETGGTLLSAHGPAEALLLAWKVAQTLMEYAAGIATATTEIITAATGPDKPAPVVACTRKTFPGTRAIAAAAVRAGGGVMHRLGLSETILVFPEHQGFLPAAPDDWLPGLIAGAPEKRVVVECASVATACAMASAGAAVVQLEKFSADDTFRVVRHIHDQGLDCRVAAAGGIRPETAAPYARAGADILVTSWPYFAPPRDVSIRLRPAG